MDDDTTTPAQSPDDALEPMDDDLNPGTQNPLPEDNNTPAAPADGPGQDIPVDLPPTDTGMDAQELNDAGPATASGVNAQDETDEPKDSAVFGG
jgi:hypothetical protein